MISDASAVKMSKYRSYINFMADPTQSYKCSYLFLQIDFGSIYNLNKDLFKKAPTKESQENQGNARANRMGLNKMAYDRRTVVTPRIEKVNLAGLDWSVAFVQCVKEMKFLRIHGFEKLKHKDEGII